MMSFIILPDAQDEIDNALANSTQPGELREAINAMWTTLLSQPTIAPRVRRSTCRRFIMQKYPYSAIYQEEADRLVVVAFPHHHQRSGYWRSRLKQP
ncbi:hypothetical protein [Limnoglobus roseus]|uniref:Type II toxin-antitoxin system RelE/ParE family toxin n=1 Tax=Limnoglobus roseus TaxID=2598579 RepID=A0A5C1A4G0_9BACT|nr:hypothetical protein [Limnoglobus roseus]QEL13203.1 hypothetical protein PX52LOC_00056 [Limnoglobus roseus]